MEHLKYPIGRFDKSRMYAAEEAASAIRYLKEFPVTLRGVIAGLSESDLVKTYRPEGWNIRQLVHHLADSHINMYVRVKLSLTEERPEVKGYKESRWAELADYSMDLELPLRMLEGIHAKLVYLFEDFGPEEFDRTYYHAEYQTEYILKNVIHLYEWHSRHHLEHIHIALKN